MSNKKKHLVLGFATNQDERSVRVFTQSLRKVYGPQECDAIIITNRYENYFAELSVSGIVFLSTVNNYTNRAGLTTRIIRRIVLNGMRALKSVGMLERLVPDIGYTYRVLFENWQHPHFARWFAYERFLSLNRNYDQVLLADVKDVLFQAPFFATSNNAYVSFFDQNQVYGDDNCDTNWYRDAFGKVQLDNVVGKPALCIGTIIGTHNEILEFVSRFCHLLPSYCSGRIEQAIFNYLVYNRLLQVHFTVVDNVAGAVATLASRQVLQDVLVRDNCICRAEDRSVVPIVHMYDRFELTCIDDRYLDNTESHD